MSVCTHAWTGYPICTPTVLVPSVCVEMGCVGCVLTGTVCALLDAQRRGDVVNSLFVGGGVLGSSGMISRGGDDGGGMGAVSYTHLTLPTILLV